MRVTLKKFAEDPYHIIDKAPVIIVVNRDPRFVIIPYSVYQQNYIKREVDTIPSHTKKTLVSRIKQLLFS